MWLRSWEDLDVDISFGEVSVLNDDLEAISGFLGALWFVILVWALKRKVYDHCVLLKFVEVQNFEELVIQLAQDFSLSLKQASD